MTLEFFKRSKPTNTNNTGDVDADYLYKVAETEFDPDDPISVIESVREVDNKLGDLNNVIAIPKK